MSNVKKIIISLVALLFITGCGLEINEGGTEAQDKIQAQNLLDEYSSIVGVYESEIYNADKDKTYKASIELYTIPVQSGNDSSGKPRISYSLMAYYKHYWNNPDILIEYTRVVQYSEEDNRIYILQQQGQGQSQGFVSNYFSAEGTLVDGVLDLEITNHQGVLGYFNGKRVME